MDIVSNCLLRLNLYAYRLVIFQFISKELSFSLQWMRINKETELGKEKRINNCSKFSPKWDIFITSPPPIWLKEHSALSDRKIVRTKDCMDLV